MKASVFIAASMDGYIARPDGSLDWLHAGAGSAPVDYGYDAFMATVDALVIGRKTYETVLGFPKWPYGAKPVFVLSSGLLAPAPEGAVLEQLSGEPRDIVLQLEGRGIRHIYVDGGDTIQRFLRAGLIQRLIVNRIPVLIGSGIPLFGETGRDLVLEHVVTRVYATGLVQSEYTVTSP